MSFSIASDYASGLFTSKVRLTETPFMQNVTEAGKVTPEMAYTRPKENPKKQQKPPEHQRASQNQTYQSVSSWHP